jgi:hypothetical protein
MKHWYPFILFVALATCTTTGISQTLQTSEPVKLTTFTSQLVNDKIWLTWSDQQEQAINYYGIERSYDNKEFTQVALLFPGEEASVINNNAYKDPIKNTATSVIYYRLKLVDKGGRYKYSETRTVHLGNNLEPVQLITSPNPVMNELHVSVPATWNNKTVSCQLLNTDGSVIKSFTIQHTATIGMANVPAGTYYIKVIDGHEKSIQTIIKRNSR